MLHSTPASLLPLHLSEIAGVSCRLLHVSGLQVMHAVFRIWHFMKARTPGVLDVIADCAVLVLSLACRRQVMAVMRAYACRSVEASVTSHARCT